MKYKELKENVWAIYKTDYDALETDSSGVKKVGIAMPDGTMLEVFDKSSGTIDTYAECLDGLWFER